MGAVIKDIVRALKRLEAISEWVIQTREATRRWRNVGGVDETGDATETHTRVVVFRDRAAGRGSASFSVRNEGRADLVELARDAAQRASTGAGPAWSLPDPAAPARVTVADDWLRDHLSEGVDEAVAQLTGNLPDGHRIAGASVSASRERIGVITSSGFASDYTGTRVSATAGISTTDSKPGEVERVVRDARRMNGLNLAEALAGAATRLADRRSASQLPSGSYDALLTGEAITCDSAAPDRGDHFGWFDPFVAQASGSSARQGLSRYQPGQSVFGDDEPTGDPLTLTSDGTLDFGVRSAPFGPYGEPVRKFDLVRDGVAAGLALDLREAGLRRVTANGGVRNLVVGAGRSRMLELQMIAQLEIQELLWLDVNPTDGRVVAEVGLAYLRKGTERKAVTGGIITGNVFELLSRSRLSSQRTRSGWYDGPKAILVPRLEIQ